MCRKCLIIDSSITMTGRTHNGHNKDSCKYKQMSVFNDIVFIQVYRDSFSVAPTVISNYVTTINCVKEKQN